jgi:hypothetical protein
MIRNYKDLAHFRTQLAHAENALVSLHERVYAKNPRNYAVFSESYIDMILELRAEIDAFLKIAPARTDIPPSGDNAIAGGEAVVREADSRGVAVAGAPESSS